MITGTSSFPEHIKLSGEDLALRDWTEADLAAMPGLFGHPDIAYWTPIVSPFDAAAARARLDRDRQLRREGTAILLAITVDGVRLFDSVQATWNLLERSAGEALAEAHAAGMGVAIKEALANGRLTARNDDPAFAPRRRVLESVAARLGTTIDALALAAALAQPWADVVLSGAVTGEQLTSNLGALVVGVDEAAEVRLRTLEEPAEEYWGRRWRLAWN